MNREYEKELEERFILDRSYWKDMYYTERYPEARWNAITAPMSNIALFEAGIQKLEDNGWELDSPL
ncbi:hypothetical protein KC950_02855 [Candidatus Saccharibacteria bacterium]|nr:hypothetical protein [Candidatus Saccharibacteria bacterium]